MNLYIAGRYNGVSTLTVKERAFQTLVHPKHEHSSSIRNHQQVTQIKQVEQVQRNVARFVLSTSPPQKNISFPEKTNVNFYCVLPNSGALF